MGDFPLKSLKLGSGGGMCLNWCILSSNEAPATGALEAGVELASSYPGSLSVLANHIDDPRIEQVRLQNERREESIESDSENGHYSWNQTDGHRCS